MSFTNDQIQLDDLPKVENLEFQNVASRYFKVLVINIFLFYAFCSATLIVINVFVGANSFFNDLFWYLLIILVGLFLVQTIIYKIGFRKRKYALREKDIIYSRGLLYNKTTSLPFNRVQHIEISNSLLERKFNLSTLKVYSAGESGGDIAIHGLPKEIADMHYTFLTNILNERI